MLPQKMQCYWETSFEFLSVLKMSKLLPVVWFKVVFTNIGLAYALWTLLFCHVFIHAGPLSNWRAPTSGWSCTPNEIKCGVFKQKKIPRLRPNLVSTAALFADWPVDVAFFFFCTILFKAPDTTLFHNNMKTPQTESDLAKCFWFNSQSGAQCKSCYTQQKTLVFFPNTNDDS